MSLFEVMESYFRRYEEDAIKKTGRLPIFPYNERTEPTLYIGEKSETDWIQWKAQEKMRIHDFSAIEEKWGVKLHEDIKEYFNSMWFLELDGFIEGECYNMFRCPPGRELEEFYISTTGYQDAHNGSLEYIPIGIGTRQDLLIVVHNETGKVFLEDYDFGTFEQIADSLEDLIRQFQPSKHPTP